MAELKPCPFCGNDQSIITTDKMQYRECNFIDFGWLGELSCSVCREVIGTRADTQRMKFCPYCGRHRQHAPAEETEENPEDWSAQIHD